MLLTLLACIPTVTPPTAPLRIVDTGTGGDDTGTVVDTGDTGTVDTAPDTGSGDDTGTGGDTGSGDDTGTVDTDTGGLDTGTPDTGDTGVSLPACATTGARVDAWGNYDPAASPSWGFFVQGRPSTTWDGTPGTVKLVGCDWGGFTVSCKSPRITGAADADFIDANVGAAATISFTASGGSGSTETTCTITSGTGSMGVVTVFVTG